MAARLEKKTRSLPTTTNSKDPKVNQNPLSGGTSECDSSLSWLSYFFIFNELKVWRGTVSRSRARERGPGFTDVEKEKCTVVVGKSTVFVPFLHGCLFSSESHSGQQPDPVRHLRRDDDPATLGMFR